MFIKKLRGKCITSQLQQRFAPSARSVAMTSYQVHLLLPPPNNADAQTVIEFVYDILFDGFAVMDDDVTVELNREEFSVILTYDQLWTCRIVWNDAATVLTDAQQWARLYATDRSDNDRMLLSMCHQRLDIISDPDPQRDYLDDYLALVEHLQTTFDPSWTFDPAQNEFIQ
jgi:hypothetical protein